MFRLLKRTVLMRQFLEYPQHMFWLRNRKNSFNYTQNAVSRVHKIYRIEKTTTKKKKLEMCPWDTDAPAIGKFV